MQNVSLWTAFTIGAERNYGTCEVLFNETYYDGFRTQSA